MGRSSLMVIKAIIDRYPVQNLRAARVTEILLRTAEEQGLLRDLLAITEDDGDNVFHFHWPRCRALLRILLEALERLCPTAPDSDCLHRAATRAAVSEGLLARGVPADISGLVLSFLPPFCQLRYNLLNQKRASGGHGYTPLHRAVKTFGPTADGAEDVVKLLVEAGADPDITDRHGDTALDEALYHFAQLLESGYHCDSPVVEYLYPLTGASGRLQAPEDGHAR